MRKPSKERVFSIRMTALAYTRFLASAKKYGNPSDVARELFAALNEGRLRITPPKKKQPTISNIWRLEDEQND